MVRPLRGIRIVDLSEGLAGALAAQLLGEQGADVFQMRGERTPELTGPLLARLDRGKTCQRADLGTAAGRQRILQVCRSADVVIEDRRPGDLDDAGLGHQDVASHNPGVVYCSLPPFSPEDPRSSAPAAERVVAAASAAYAPLGAGAQPVYNALPIVPTFGAFLGATGVVMALIARLRYGIGQRVIVPLHHAMFVAIGAKAIRKTEEEDPAVSMDVFGGGLYRCADERWVQLSMHNPAFTDRLCAAVAADVSIDASLFDRDRLARDAELRGKLKRALGDLFVRRPAHAWEELLGSRGVPLSMVRTTHEWTHTPQARACGAVAEVEDAEYGTLLIAGSPIRFEGEPYPATPRRLVHEGEQDLWSLPAADFPTRARGGAEPGAPLAGLRVIDTTQVLAGPVAGRLLSEFGADVLKVNDPRNAPSGYRYHADVNRGKRSVLLDLHEPSEADALRRLSEVANVVLENFSTGTAERLGIGWDRLSAVNPRLVYVSLWAFGGSGPWATWRGYEVHAQAVTGMMDRLGGSVRSPEKQPYLLNDYGTGVLTALAAGLGLFRTLAHGEGGRVHTSLVGTATVLQALYIGRDDDETGPRGPWATGEGMCHRIYASADGWFFMSGDPNRQRALRALVDGATDGPVGTELVQALEQVFAREPSATWLPILARLGFEAHSLVSLGDLLQKDYVRERGLLVDVTNGDGTSFQAVGNPVQLSRTPVRPATSFDRAGEQTARVLSWVRERRGWLGD